MFFGLLIGLLIGYWLFNKPQKTSNTSQTDDFLRNTIVNVLARQDLDDSQKIAQISQIVSSGKGRLTKTFVPESEERIQADADVTKTNDAKSAPQAVITPTQSIVTETVRNKPTISKTEQLLYFGVFLFVTSVGLFTAFSDIAGTVRTFMVAALTAIIYGLGLYLYTQTSRLRKVGEAFIGIGLIIAPLIGIAAYNFIFDQTNGSMVWFFTSLLVLGLYGMSLNILKNAFISYLLLGGIVSTMLSIGGVVEAPNYIFIWLLLASGLIVQLIRIYSPKLQPLKSASTQVSQLLIPASMFLSLFAVSNQGIFQLAVTLLLGSLFYFVEAKSYPDDKENYYTSADTLLLISAALFGYVLSGDSVVGAGLVLVAATLLHAGILWFKPKLLNSDMYITTLITTLASIALLLGEGWLLVIALIVSCLYGTVIAIKHNDEYGVLYVYLGVLAIVLTAGQRLFSNALDYEAQLYALLVCSVLLASLTMLIRSKKEQLYTIAKSVSIGIIVILAVLTTPISETSVLLTSISLYGFMLTIRLMSHDHDWAIGASFVIYLPLAHALLTAANSDTIYLTVSVIIGLLASISSALVTHTSWHRWASTICWLLLPFALWQNEILFTEVLLWHVIAWYSLVAIVLALSRAIARGRITISNNASVLSLTRSESISYVAGFFTAVTIVILTALLGEVNMIAQALVLYAVTLGLIIYGKTVEQNGVDFIALSPILLHVATFRLLVPFSAEDAFYQADPSLIVPLALIVVSYITLMAQRIYPSQKLMNVNTYMLFVPALTVLYFAESTWPMSLSLIAASIITIITRKDLSLETKESFGFIATLGLSWTAFIGNIDNLVVHAHFFAVLLTIYAYINYKAGLLTRSNNYLKAALTAVTVPVAFAALAYEDPYTIILLVEQTFIFMIGVSLSRTFISKWGLYTTLAAILFQLRGLGWAMLAVLSVFLIGLAIYYSLKQEQDS